MLLLQGFHREFFGHLSTFLQVFMHCPAISSEGRFGNFAGAVDRYHSILEANHEDAEG